MRAWGQRGYIQNSGFSRLFLSANAILLGLLASAPGARADVYSNVPEASEYLVAYELPIPAYGAFNGTTPVPYSTDNTAAIAVGGFDRVAYYLELTTSAGVTTWGYASMDAFTAIPSQLGLPHDTNNNVTFQRSVSNLSVLSNAPGVINGAFDQGEIEFYHYGYTSGNANPPVFGSGSGAFDWGDVVGTNASGFGSFQIAAPSARQMVISYNRWAVSDGAPDDIGIGNAPGTQHVDWSYQGNAINYAARKLVVLVRPTRMQVAFTALPRNQQITPRNLSTNLAALPVAGTESAGGFDAAVLREFRNGTQVGADVTQPLAYAGGSAPFSFNPSIPAELASYSLEIYLRKNGTLYLARRVSGVCAGDVYLWYGQSNAEAPRFVDSADAYVSPWVRTFSQSSDSGSLTQLYPFWSQAEGDGSRDVSGGVGQWALVVGRKLVDAYGIPIAILNGARGGYTILQLQPDDTQPNNLEDSGGVYRVYNRLRYRANLAGVAGAVRGIFFYHGEQEQNNAAEESDGFAGLVTAWKRDYPSVERIFVTQVHAGCSGGVDPAQPALRDAQRRYPDVYGNVRVMSSNGLTQIGDNCHFPFALGYETHGLHVFPQVARELYGAPSVPNIDAPNPLRVEQTSPAADRLRIVLRDPGAAITIESGAMADFRLDGSSANLTSAMVTSAGIELQYDGPTTGATGLDYLAHVGGGGGWIRNANGVGLLTFSEPITVPAPVVTLGSRTLQAIPGTTVTLAGSATTPSGAVTRLEILIDGLLYTAVNGSASISSNWVVPASGTHQVTVRATNTGGFTAAKSFLVFAGNGASAPGGVSAGLSVWLKPESGLTTDSAGRVTQWLDSSGNGNGCVQAVDAQKPVVVQNYFGLLPGLTFNGANCLNASGGMPAGSYTKILRATVSDLTPNNNLLSAANGSGIPHALYMAQSPYARLYHGSIFASASTAITAGQSFVLTARYDSATKLGTLYLNGTQAGSGTASADSTNVTYQLGAFNGGSFLSGAIGEVMIYNRALPDADRAAVESYLANRSTAPPLASRLAYSDWAAANVPTGKDATPAGDANGNGISNLVEYALGLNPAASGVPPLLKVQQNSGLTAVSYTHPTNLTGVTVQLQESPDLQQWTAVADAAGATTAGVETRAYTEAAPVAGRVFYRLAVSQTP